MKFFGWLTNYFIPKAKVVPKLLLVDGIHYDISTREGSLAYERALDESHDIYKLVARIKNNVAKENLKMTNVGNGLCNTFATLLKELHTFADKLSDDEQYKELKDILKKHEQTPAEIIKWATPRKGR